MNVIKKHFIKLALSNILLINFLLTPVLAENKFSIGLTKEEKAWLVAHPEITIAHARNFPPYIYQDPSGNYAGMAVDFWNLVEQLTGLSTRIYPSGIWNDFYEAAKRREVDVISTLSVTDERKQWFSYSDPYIVIPSAIFTRNNDTGFKTKEDLNGKPLAMVKGFWHTENLERNYPSTKILYKDTVSDTLIAVSEGKADATVMGMGSGLSQANKLGLYNLKVASVFESDGDKLAFGVRKDWPELTSIIKKVMDTIPQRKKNEIINKWGTSARHSIQETLLLDLSTQERRWLKDHQSISMCIDPAWMPFEQISEAGKYEGILVDYINLISERTGITFELKPTKNFQQSIEKFSADECTVLSSWAPVEEEDIQGLMTIPYLTVSVVFAVHKDEPFIHQHETLSGRRIGVVINYPVEGKVRRFYPEAELVLVDNIDEGVRMVAAGKLDVFVGNQTSIGFSIQKQSLTNVKIGGIMPGPGLEKVSTLVSKEEPLLVSILNKAIATITQSERSRITSRWFAIKFEHSIDYSLVWKVVFGFVFVLATVLTWSFIIRRQKIALDNSEALLRKARDDAEAANQAKSKFLSNMSHELRTPLNAILGYAYILQNDPVMAKPHQDKIKIIQRSGKSLLHHINDILDLSKIEAGKVELNPTTLKFANFVEYICSYFKTQAEEKGIDLVCKFHGDNSTTVSIDGERLQQVLLNLVGNAVKFTQKGKVEVSLEMLTPEVAQNDDECHIRFSVRDTGIGIPVESLEEIFEPFIQLKQESVQTEGTGLGLNIAYQLVSILGGNLMVDSQLNKGSCFWFDLILPLTEAADNTTMQHIKVPVGYSGMRRRILLVDDMADNRSMLYDFFIGFGFEVEHASNGAEGISLASTTKPDIIFLDLLMPSMSGYETLASLRNIPETKNIPVIAISASAGEEQYALESGFNAFLSKPVFLDNIPAALDNILNLKWIYTENQEDESRAEITPPPVDELIKIKQLADIGKLMSIAKWADDIISQGPVVHKEFAIKMKSMAQNGLDIEIIEILEQYLSFDVTT